MSTRIFKLKWAGIYRENQSGSKYYGGTNPIRVGGYDGHISVLGFDSNGILAALQSSVTTPTVKFKWYVTDSGTVEVNMHKEAYNRKSSSVPGSYYIGTSWYSPTGWNTYDLTTFGRDLTNYPGVNTFQEALEAGFRGPTLRREYNDIYTEGYGYTGDSYHAYIVVEGIWNTPPSKPTITFPSGGEIFDEVHEVKANPATDAQQSASELRYKWAVHDGTGWDYYDLGPAGESNKVIDFSDYGETSSAKLAVRAHDGESFGDWAYSNVFTISHNKPPDIPTNLSPTGGAFLDRTQDNQFSWQHNDPQTQLGYEFEWRVKGTTSWDSTLRLWSNEYYIAQANLFPVGEIEWRVSTIDQGDLISKPSPIQIVFATEETDAPEIISPVNNGTVNVPNPVIEWSSSAQDEFRLELELGGNILWSNEQRTAAKAITLPYSLENNQTYSINVSVRDTDGLWSAKASHNFSTSFTEPEQAVISSSAFNEEARIEIGIENIDSNEVGSPEITGNEVFRSLQGEDDFIKIGSNIAKNGVFADLSPASGVVYEYKVRSWGDNGTYVDSETVEAAVEFSGSVLSLASDLWEMIWLRYNPERSMNKDLNRTLFQFNGRKNQVAEYDATSKQDYDLSFAIREGDSLRRIYRILDSKQTLLYRDSRGRKSFVTLGSYSLNDKRSGGYELSFIIDQMDYREDVE